jgi:Tol biopolymer transport system component
LEIRLLGRNIESVRITARQVAFVVLLTALVGAFPASAGRMTGGGWIAFDEREFRAGGDSWEIFIVRSDGSGRRRVTPPGRLYDKFRAGWSPDGRTIAFRGQGAKTGLFLVRIDGTGWRRLTAGAEDDYPAWSRDGRRIAFRRGHMIWTMSADGRNHRRIVGRNSRQLNGGLAWSPNGRRLAFGRADGLWTIGANGLGLHRLARKGWDPSWSPDGRRIVFESGGGIYSIAADRANLRRLNAVGHDPSWSPDGLRIAFDGDNGIYVMNADGMKSHRIMKGYPETGNPAWGPG